MSRMTFVAGAVLTASQVNTYLMKQAVDVCTSSTRPSSPTEGQVIYETDTDRLMVYSTVTTTWQPPWNMPWGRVGYAQITANSSTFTTGSDISGLSLGPTAVANRLWRVWVKGQCSSSVTTDAVILSITDGAGTVVGQMDAQLSSSVGVDVCGFAQVTTVAGTNTYKVKGSRTGTGNAFVGAAATVPAFIMIEDIGPAAAPA